MSTSQVKKKSGWTDRFLNVTERFGNALPHPATLFAIFALTAVLLSGIAAFFDMQAMHPGTKEVIKVVNLMSVEGLHRILTEMVDNFTSFAPLGIVMVAMLGIGVAEGSGLIGALIRLLVLSAPKKMLTFVIVLAGILSNTASDVGYVLLIPLAGIIFVALDRHPIAGMAAAFAGVSGGFSANLILGTIDPLLAGLSTEAAKIIDPNYIVNPTANYFFMVVSTFLIAFLGTVVTEKLIVPRLGEYKDSHLHKEEIKGLSADEKRGLRWASMVCIFLTIITIVGLVPEDGIFRGENGGFLNSPLIKGVVALLFLGAGLCGVAFGFGSKKFKSDADVMKGMAESMKTLAGYFVLVFFAAQFVAYFKWSNLGVVMAIKGANLLLSADIGLIPLMILFVLLSAVINMVMGSASAKWAIMAPIFIPMFMLIGYSPELSQVVYRIGDSVTNVISPMMSFFALIIAYIQKYDKNAGIGTVIATMLPYSVAFFIGWVILLVIWLGFGLPLGPGAGIHYVMPGAAG
ncbi:MAG: AbgT family transporter [Marinifilaceae bacterium]|jgi:aminobenzoyl-glutamate transport protein|nr:AbgT family transporter [Marinifilaceae bacterium]